MFTRTSYFVRKLRSLSLKIFSIIENNGKCNFYRNGEEIFIENMFKFLSNNSQVKLPVVIFDIGANIGEYSLMLKEKLQLHNCNYNVHLFEPTKYCFLKIKDKFEDDERFTLNNFGISNRNSKTAIYYDKEGSGLASLYQRELNHYSIELKRTEEIMLRRLDEYIKENDIKHINFIKIDIEGHELRAFEGMGEYLSCNFIDFVQFEYGGANLDSHSSLLEIYNLFEDRGFKVAKVMPKGLEIREYKPFMDNFEYANYVAISKNVLTEVLV
jgi:FkbM family methyltransferase